MPLSNKNAVENEKLLTGVQINQILDDDEDSIDFFEIYIEIKRRLWMVIFSAVLCGAMGYMVSRFVLTPTYTSTSMIFVMSKERP